MLERGQTGSGVGAEAWLTREVMVDGTLSQVTLCMVGALVGVSRRRGAPYRRGSADARDGRAWGERDGLERSRHLGGVGQVLTVHFEC